MVFSLYLIRPVALCCGWPLFLWSASYPLISSCSSRFLSIAFSSFRYSFSRSLILFPFFLASALVCPTRHSVIPSSPIVEGLPKRACGHSDHPSHIRLLFGVMYVIDTCCPQSKQDETWVVPAFALRVSKLCRPLEQSFLKNHEIKLIPITCGASDKRRTFSRCDPGGCCGADDVVIMYPSSS